MWCVVCGVWLADWLTGRQDGVERIRDGMGSSGMKKNLKKGIAFVKKVRALASVDDESRKSLLHDAISVNLKNHVEEVAVAMVHPNLKSSDIPSVVELSSLLHQRCVAVCVLSVHESCVPRRPQHLTPYLPRAVLCCAVLCCAVLCYVVLC